MLVSRPGSSVRVKVLDFGIARVPLEGSPAGITTVGSILGTPSYMSPEQCAGRAIDARSDLYSLGIILYEVVNGRLPFVAEDALALLSHHLASAPAPMNSDVPPKIADIITRLLEKDPAQRVQSAQDLLDIFDAAALSSQGTAIERGAGPLATDRQFFKIRRLFVLAAPLGTRLRKAIGAAEAWVMQRAKRRFRIRTFETSLGWVVTIALMLAAGALLLAAPGWLSHASGPAVPGSSGAAAAKLDSVLPRGSRAEFQRQVERIEMLEIV